MFRKSYRKNGSAAVELAVCLPVIVLLTFGAIEGASMAFLRQTLVQTAYEGVKVAARRGSTDAAALNAAQQVAAGRNLSNVNLRFSRGNIASIPPGTPITLFASAPTDANSAFPFGPFRGQTVTVQATMAKE